MLLPLPKLGRVLVVDDSIVWREMMETVLRVHCRDTIGVGTLAEAIAAVDADPEIEVVLCDVVLPDGEGFGLLEHLGRRASARPAVILATCSPSETGRRTAAALGATDYLAKPIAPRDLLASFKKRHGEPLVSAPRRRAQPVGTASLIDTGHPDRVLLRWDIDDLGQTGAFLRTGGPLDLGAVLDLLLEVDGIESRVVAIVQRVQQPGWKQTGGVGIRFLHLCPAAKLSIDRWLTGGEAS